MDFEMKSRVYIVVDANGRIVQIEGEYSLQNIADIDSAIMVEEGDPCDRLNHAQTAYLEKPLRDENGVCRYKYTGGEIVERTAEEIAADVAAMPELEESEEDLLLELMADHEERICMLEIMSDF